VILILLISRFLSTIRSYNSITASAKSIHIDFEIQSDTKDIHLAIVDDGLGMDFFQLQQAMTLGSKDPNQNRDMDDLGRFGLGLKTASFSQCKCLTLISKQAENICGLQMDLDENERHQDWGVRELSTSEMQSFLGFERLAECASGTLVAWRKCDRLLDGFENNNLSDEEFAKAIGNALIFVAQYTCNCYSFFSNWC